MQIKGVMDGDFINYKLPSLLIEFPKCSGKCDKENGTNLCQGYILNSIDNKEISIEKIYNMFKNSIFAKAITCVGLEPLDSSEDLYNLITFFRSNGCNSCFVIYTGYTEQEVISNPDWERLLHLGNIIFKYGRFRPNEQPHFDEVLGVNLVSSNQYGKKYE